MNKDDILRAFAPKIEAVEIDGETIYIRQLRGDQRAKLVDAINKYKEKSFTEQMNHFSLPLIAELWVNESGERIFQDNEIAQLASLNVEILDRLASAVMRVSGMGTEAVETAEKNS